jgi:alpha-ribazole phosphatase
MQTKTIILIRHAMTESNAIGRYSGVRTDEGLSDDGIREIKIKRDTIRSILSTEPPFVISGPMKRAKETAALLFPSTPLKIVSNLTETDFGNFEGKTFEELGSDADYQKWIDSCGTIPFPGGDDRSEYIARSMDGFFEILSLSKEIGETVAVCHGGNIMAVMNSLTGGEYYDFRVKNLGGYVIKIREDDEKISVISYDRIDCGSDS